MKKIKEAVRRRKAQKGYDLPDKYKNVRDLQWSDDLKRELLKFRWALGPKNPTRKRGNRIKGDQSLRRATVEKSQYF